MFSQISKLILLGGAFLSLSLYANESAHGEAAPEHGEAAAESKTENPGWLEIEARISSLEAKVMAKNRAIESLIEEKAHVKPTSSKLNQIVEEIGKEDRERRKLVEDLEKEKTILHFRFPERGARKNRKYQKTEVKPVDEMEASLGIDGHLNRSMKTMRGQYGEEEKKDTKARVTPKPTPEGESSILMQK